jgi:hypothetical protein
LVKSQINLEELFKEEKFEQWLSTFSIKSCLKVLYKGHSKRKDKLCDSFMIFWNKNKQDILNGNNSKIDTYFSLKKCFDREKYTEINDFKIHYSLCNKFWV